ncbi:hypothetical protein Tco_0733206, partial [Tanacetum coccineum]
MDEVSNQHFYCFNVEDDPKTFDEAIKSQDVAFWKEAINDEIDSILGNNTWVLADLPPGCKPLGCKWIFKRKLKMDVKTDFLNGELDEEVYMNQPQDFIMSGNENKIGIQSQCYREPVSLLSPCYPLRITIAPANLNSCTGGFITLAPELPLVSPFLCSDDSEADSESEPAEQRPERHDDSCPDPNEAIPFGRPYRTHPNGPRKLLTAERKVIELDLSCARRLAWRRVSHRSLDHHSSPDFTSDSSSSSSSSDSSSDISLGLAPLSTVFIPTQLTSESSLDSSSERSLDSSSPSAGPSRKRCRSPTTLVPSSTPVSRSIAPALADLPPRKRFRDHTTMDIREDEEEFEAEASAGGNDGRLVVPLDRITEFKTTQRQLEAGQLMASEERDDMNMTITRSGMIPEAIEEIVNRQVEEALAAYEATRAANALEAESQSQNCSDGGHGNGGNGNPNENNRGARHVARE